MKIRKATKKDMRGIGEIIEDSSLHSKDLTRKIFSSFLFIIGIALILNSLSGITGFVIASSIEGGLSSILGLILIIGGVVLFVTKRKPKESKLEKTAREIKIYKKAQVALKSRAMGKYKDLRRMALRMGYVIKNGSNHYEVYFSDGKTMLKGPDNYPVTIPYHKEKPGTYFGILKNLLNNDPYQF